MLRKESVNCDSLAALLVDASTKAKIKKLQAEIAEFSPLEYDLGDTNRLNNLSYYLDVFK